MRGNIIKVLEEAEAGKEISATRLDLLTGTAFDILRRAAMDITDIETYLKKVNQE
jgi:hypothetical protein